jgi:hypothetical protein
MSAQVELPAPSPLSKYATRGALTFYALVLPAIIAEAVFSVAIASTPGALVTEAAPYGDAVFAAVQLLPLAILALSAYAVFSFRPSILVTLLVASFFVAVSVANGITFLGTRLELGATVILVVVASFLALAGFNYARGVRLLGGRHPDVTSSGPLGYNLLGIALDSFVPLAAALGLVLLVETIVGDLGVQAALLPQPLSTLASLYLQTRIGLVFTTLFVAGASIWVMRQIIEPVILHFTLSASDARRELLSEIEPTTKSVKKISRYKPSGGLAWGVLGTAYCAGIALALAIFLSRGEFLRELLATVNLNPPPPTPLENLLQTTIEGALVKIDIIFAQTEGYIRSLIQLLWG